MSSAGYIRLSAEGEMTACLTGRCAYALRDVEVAVGVHMVAERSTRQPQHAADMAGRERNPEAVGGGVGQALDAVGPKVVVLALLAVGDHRRAGRLEARNGVADGIVVERVEAWVGAPVFGDRLQQRRRSRDTSNGFGWKSHAYLVVRMPWGCRVAKACLGNPRAANLGFMVSANCGPVQPPGIVLGNFTAGILVPAGWTQFLWG